MDFRIKLTLFVCAALAIGVGAVKLQTPTVSAQAVAAKPSPTPAVQPVVGKQPQTLDSLKSFLAARLARPEVARGRVGVKIASLNTGKVIYEQDADKYFMPASNMKNFTIAAAISRSQQHFLGLHQRIRRLITRASIGLSTPLQRRA